MVLDHQLIVVDPIDGGGSGVIGLWEHRSPHPS